MLTPEGHCMRLHNLARDTEIFPETLVVSFDS